MKDALSPAFSQLTPQTDGASRPRDPRVGAVVVMCHFTQPHLLERLLESIQSQVEHIFIIDNTPAEFANACPIPEAYRDRITHVPLAENTGVPYAQNVGIEKAMQQGLTHVLLLDDDSALPEGMVRGMLATEAALVASGKKVASVGPVFLDEKTGEYSPVIRHRYLRVKRIPVDLNSRSPMEADYIIASGSLISIDALRVIGPMRGELFLDWFDIEWGLRAMQFGYQCYVDPKVVMRHSIGDTSTRFMGRSVNLHSDNRTYYLVRNAVYLMSVPHMGWKWRTVTALKLPLYVLFFPMHSKTPMHCFLLLMRACFDGCIGKLGRRD